MTSVLTPWFQLDTAALSTIALVYIDDLPEQPAREDGSRATHHFTLLHICRSWRSTLLASAKLWSQLPLAISASIFQALLPHESHELEVTDTYSSAVDIWPLWMDSTYAPLRLVCTIAHPSSPDALSLHIEAHTLLGGVLLQASPLITRLSVKDVGTSDVVTLATQVAPHIHELILETSRHGDLKLQSRQSEAVTPISFPHLETLVITSDSPSSLQALTNLFRQAHKTRMRIRWRGTRSKGNVSKCLECLLSGRASALPTLYLDVESSDYTRLMSCSDPELARNAEDVPFANPDILTALVDISFEWHTRLSVLERSRLNDFICVSLLKTSSGIKHVVLALGDRGGDAIDLSNALVTFADLNDGLQTLVLRGDWEYATEALKFTLLPDLYEVVLEDSERLSPYASMVAAVRAVHDTFNDSLRTMRLGAKVYVGAEPIFAHRSSSKMWNIMVPEYLWLVWDESTIIDFYDAISDETQKASNEAYDEWFDDFYLLGLGGPETFEQVEQALIERVQREQDEQLDEEEGSEASA